MNTTSPTTIVVTGDGCPPVSSLSFSSFGSDEQSSLDYVKKGSSPLEEQLRPAYQVSKKQNQPWDDAQSCSGSTVVSRSLSASSDGSAGIFIDNPDGKPMPMTTGRLILPSICYSFRKQTRRLSTGMFTMGGGGGGGKSRSASILRRTGADDSCVFSDPMNELKTSRYLHEQYKEEEQEVVFTAATTAAPAATTKPAVGVSVERSAFCSSWDCSKCSFPNSCAGGMEPVCARCGLINSKFQKIQNDKLQQRMSSRSVAGSLQTKRWWKRWKELSENKLIEQKQQQQQQQQHQAPKNSTAARKLQVQPEQAKTSATTTRSCQGSGRPSTSLGARGHQVPWPWLNKRVQFKVTTREKTGLD